MGDVLDLNAFRAARAGSAPAEAPAADPVQRPGWLCRLDVFAPEEGKARAGFLALNKERLNAPADLVGLAVALEQIAASLRHGAQADAV